MNPSPIVADADLIREILDGRADALAELYDRYHRLAFSVALAVLGDRQTAAEVILDVFVQVWRRAGTYRPEQAKVSTWLTAIARHRAIDVLRRQGSRLEANTVSWDEAPAAPTNPRDLEEQAETFLQGQRVRAALGRLPAEQRAVLALAYFQGFTHQQIAANLGQPLGTVKTRLRLAMQKLRLLLQEGAASPDTSADLRPAYRTDKSKKGPLNDRRKTRS